MDFVFPPDLAGIVLSREIWVIKYLVHVDNQYQTALFHILFFHFFIPFVCVRVCCFVLFGQLSSVITIKVFRKFGEVG